MGTLDPEQTGQLRLILEAVKSAIKKRETPSTMPPAQLRGEVGNEIFRLRNEGVTSGTVQLLLQAIGDEVRLSDQPNVETLDENTYRLNLLGEPTNVVDFGNTDPRVLKVLRGLHERLMKYSHSPESLRDTLLWANRTGQFEPGADLMNAACAPLMLLFLQENWTLEKLAERAGFAIEKTAMEVPSFQGTVNIEVTVPVTNTTGGVVATLAPNGDQAQNDAGKSPEGATSDDKPVASAPRGRGRPPKKEK